LKGLKVTNTLAYTTLGGRKAGELVKERKRERERGKEIKRERERGR
jgi:hypothetical protein